MRRVIRKAVVTIAVGALSTVMAASAFAEDWPLVSGDYWEVTGIDVKDGGSWKYANWLATEWRKNLEFTKSKGWIKDYMILANVHARKGEADLYLIRVRADIPSGPEGEKRQKEYSDWVKKSNEQMVDESGNRAEYREVTSDSLLQVLKFRK
jgi:hypothetical protein